VYWHLVVVGVVLYLSWVSSCVLMVCCFGVGVYLNVCVAVCVALGVVGVGVILVCVSWCIGIVCSVVCVGVSCRLVCCVVGW